MKYQQTCEAIKASFLDLAKKPYIDTMEIHEWFENHINISNSAATGFPGRLLGKNGSHATKISIEDGTPVLRLTISWFYDGTSDGAPPSLTYINDIIPLIDVVHKPTEDDGFCLTGELKMDLNVWRNIVLTYVSEKLESAFIHNTARPDMVEQALVEIELLRSYFYPKISMDTLVLATQLGMVESDSSVFVKWFENHLASMSNHQVIVPGDLHDI